MILAMQYPFLSCLLAFFLFLSFVLSHFLFKMHFIILNDSNIFFKPTDNVTSENAKLIFMRFKLTCLANTVGSFILFLIFIL